MYISANLPVPSILHAGDTDILISCNSFIANTTDNPVNLTLVINSDPNVVFVDGGIEKTCVNWQQIMTTSKESYQRTLTIRILHTPPSDTACSFTLNAVDSNAKSDSSGTYIDYV